MECLQGRTYKGQKPVPSQMQALLRDLQELGIALKTLAKGLQEETQGSLVVDMILLLLSLELLWVSWDNGPASVSCKCQP